MNTRLSIVALALSSLVAGHALAADASVGKTRDAVQNEDRAQTLVAQQHATSRWWLAVSQSAEHKK
ncbi:MAG: hypothetical protein CVU22_22830 [Betaproteobacteria bacterium HGW-Betaproteobacteria-16]|nr:MAG: hypothetical protein CVU22_22830 [Betaproteobacteria bacterium HGW-Betaproteobacteria-16]